jgi:hypothetical protein
MNLEERIYLIKELDIQRANKRQQVDNLTREVVVLSAAVKQLTTPAVLAHPLYQVRHEQTKLGPTPSRIPKDIIPLVGHPITVITDPSNNSPVAVALAQPLSSHPLGHQEPQEHEEDELDNESPSEQSY